MSSCGCCLGSEDWSRWEVIRVGVSGLGRVAGRVLCLAWRVLVVRAFGLLKYGWDLELEIVVSMHEMLSRRQSLNSSCVRWESIYSGGKQLSMLEQILIGERLCVYQVRNKMPLDSTWCAHRGEQWPKEYREGRKKCK